MMRIKSPVLQLRKGRIMESDLERLMADRDYATMNVETLLATARQALRVVHDYELLVLNGSSRRERAYGREARDRLVEVCIEIGVRQLAEACKDMISQHTAAYTVNLKELGEEHEIGKENVGRLSWWNF
jgi:hypothetical protein